MRGAEFYLTRAIDAILKMKLDLLRSSIWVSLLLMCLAPALKAQVQIFQVSSETIKGRIERFEKKNSMREATLKQLFVESGCDHLQEQKVRSTSLPNLICILPGETDRQIIVGAHFDKVSDGEGVIDNWTGASMLPSLFQSLRSHPRKHTFIFIGFTDEEEGMVGSRWYVEHLPKEAVSKIDAMINMDSLGTGSTEVWASHADPGLMRMIAAVAHSMQLPIRGMNVDNVGSTDSESFRDRHIPAMTLHSLTDESWPILHSDRDRMSAFKLEDYYASYRLIAIYLGYIDSQLPKTETAR
jgi:putative aminopeptidase FrvX